MSDGTTTRKISSPSLTYDICFRAMRSISLGFLARSTFRCSSARSSSSALSSCCFCSIAPLCSLYCRNGRSDTPTRIRPATTTTAAIERRPIKPSRNLVMLGKRVGNEFLTTPAISSLDCFLRSASGFSVKR